MDNHGTMDNKGTTHDYPTTPELNSQELIALTLPENAEPQPTQSQPAQRQRAAHESTTYGSTKTAPFIIEHRQEDHTGHTFRPSARLILTHRLRTSGLWQALAPEEFKTLILLLTFLTPNGWCRPTLPELAEAMGMSQPKARARLDRLVQTQWNGQPLAEVLARPNGLDAYLPGRLLVAHEDAAPAPEPLSTPQRPTPGREAVIACSRARYAKTREEVERQIGEMMGWGPPAFAGDDPAVAEGKRQAFQAMTGYGMAKEQTLDLLSRFDLSAVERQLAWLPQRGAKNSARFLAAAIEGDYDPPLSQRRQAPTVRTDRMRQGSVPASENTPEDE